MQGTIGPFGSFLESVSGPRTFDRLEVRERVIDTGERTLALDEVASISVGVDNRWPTKILLLLAGVIAGIVALSAYPLVAIAAVALVVTAVFVRSTSTLVIVTSDGTQTCFSSAHRAQLDEAREFLTEKLNSGDEDSKEVFIFVAEPTVEAGYAPSPEGPASGIAAAPTGTTVPAGHVRPSPETAEHTAPEMSQAESAGGLQRTAPSVQTGSVHHVDYASVIGQVTELNRFYAQTPDTKHIEERLSELEVLMRSGTPHEEGCHRVRQLSGELSTILQAYPTMTQLFQHIASLTDRRAA